MFLQQIEIQGFKSFAQKTVLEFPRPKPGASLVNSSIACIVGPNGSGKSNIVDAIRWVLGEQSLKSLRGRKSQDVIFSGSEKKNQLSLAYVALHINNEDGVMPVDFKEVVISRKLYRNGESEYMINKSKVRLQDVLMLVAQSNFGQKSYSIVSQGSIDQVIMANPADRKEYFDEAVGVKQFQLKRDSSLNKLESAWNNLRQVDALLTEITPRLTSLTRQVKRLERREKVEAELKAAQEQYFGLLWQEMRHKVDALKPSLEKKEAELKGQQQQMRQLQTQLEALEKEDSRGSGFSDLQKKYQQTLDEKNKLREEQLMLQNKIELSKQRLVDKAVSLPLPDIIKKLRAIDALEASLEKNLGSTNPAQLAQAREDLRELGRLLRELITELENPKNKAKEKAQVDPQQLADLKATEKDIEQIEKRLQEARNNIEQFNQSEEKKKGKFFSLQRDIAKEQDSFHRFSQEVSNVRVEMAKLETHLQDLEQEIKTELGNLEWLKNYKVEKTGEAESREAVQKLKRQLELIGGVDPEVADEYAKVKERHDFLTEQAEDLRRSIKSLEQVINDLDDKIQVQFDTSFKHINREFSKFFKILFDGGKAEMVLIREDISQLTAKKEQPIEGTAVEAPDAGESSILERLEAQEEQLSPKRLLKKRTGKVITGIDITATPPGKKVSSITMLSGGERSLASIALICAIIANNPSPFVILDEVDAALDEANSQRFGKIIEELAHKTQFIVITHNRATMQRSSILYGVTMGDDGISKLLSLKLEEAKQMVRQS